MATDRETWAVVDRVEAGTILDRPDLERFLDSVYAKTIRTVKVAFEPLFEDDGTSILDIFRRLKSVSARRVEATVHMFEAQDKFLTVYLPYSADYVEDVAREMGPNLASLRLTLVREVPDGYRYEAWAEYERRDAGWMQIRNLDGSPWHMVGMGPERAAVDLLR
ncbi:hypothetical protein BU16DRAFT_566099 [Lophium mytilinum]|uniref:Uncharacterized protein n=1 Tax=Lophium mytilinum TaxID=390894 RepID=A0A6A6QFK6_9PEZI|nr:hypothetical protein BU16DRAFT_566099 [Lophium mytilinum]